MQRRCLTARLLQRWAGSATATATSTCWTSASTSSMYSTITSPSSSLHRAAVPIAHRRRHAIPRAAASSSSSTAAAAAGSASSARRERGDVRGGASGTARRRRVPPASAPAPKSWSELPLRNEMLVALEEDMQLVAPTEVQCVAIPRLIDGRDTMIASNTGSGKTLAYMLPLAHVLKEYEDGLRERLRANAGVEKTGEEIDPSMYRSRRRRPRALVLGPTRELVTQVFHVAKSLSHQCKFRASLIVGGTTTIRSQQRRGRSGRSSGQAQALEHSADVVVATPGRLLELLEDYSVILDDLLLVVVDEADTMFDQGFGNEVKKIMDKIKLAREERMSALRRQAAEAASVSTDMRASDLMFMAHNNVDFVADASDDDTAAPRRGGGRAHKKMCQGAFVTATLTASVSQLMVKFFPEMVTAKTDALHRSAPNAKHNFVPLHVSNRGDGGGAGGAAAATTMAMDRISLLKNLVDKDVAKGLRTVVFCNTMECCRAVEHELRDAGIATACYHGGVPARQRVAELASFSPRPGATPSENEKKKDSSVLVCTDLAARGLDYNCVVDHVIMFDFPLTAVDYLHRSGRTARAGRAGTITSFVASKRDARLANEIEETIRRGQPLAAEHFSGAPPKSKAHASSAPTSTTASTTRKVRAKTTTTTQTRGRRGIRAGVSSSSSSRSGGGRGRQQAPRGGGKVRRSSGDASLPPPMPRRRRPSSSSR